MEEISLLQTLWIAIVEGLTEFLPVSSTGHMIILQSVLGVESTPFVKAFTVIIQLGAILSVVVIYRKRFFRVNYELSYCEQNALKRFVAKYDFYFKLLLGFVPAAVAGLLLGDRIDQLLENVNVVALMLLSGGVLMLFADHLFGGGDNQVELTYRKAFIIGLYQCIAMIPGVSRSMATIVGAMAQHLDRKKAAEFSFFLAVPTMLAATGYKVLQLYLEEGTDIFVKNASTLLIGNVVAFAVAVLAIKIFVGFISKHGFRAFGWYRIIVGTVILAMNCIQ